MKYKDFREYVLKMNVNAAVKGITLFQHYKGMVTKNEDQKQYLDQKEMPTPSKDKQIRKKTCTSNSFFFIKFLESPKDF